MPAMISAVNGENACDLYFRNLQVSTKNEGKQILKNLSGQFPSGSLIALMGPSGSGKTTLLNTLSAYNLQKTTYDALQLNGNDTNFEYLQRISCYITQDIHLNDLLSVEENMHFAADFKLGITHSWMQKEKIIEELLNSFGLSASRDTRAGKLSGGERKRLALALEMISDPKLIFLDEPTTGLDISTTQQILAYLKEIASTGKTVICTIHQVCATHFDLFDLTYVIADGQCAFQGRPQDLVPFLDEHGLPCNIYHNPVDYLMELCCGDFGKEKANQLVAASRNGVTYIQQTSTPLLLSDGMKIIPNANLTWIYQFKILMRREYCKMTRNSVLTYLRFLGSNFIGLVIGILFYNVGTDATKVFFNYNLIISTISNTILTGLLYPVLSFPLEMDVVKREIHNRYYTILQYYVTVSILELPMSILSTITSNMLVYYMSGQIFQQDRILIYLMYSIILGITVNSIGFFFGTLMNLNNAVFFASCTQLPLVSVSGFAIMPQDVPYVIEKIARFLYPRRALQGFVVAIFGLDSRKLECPSTELYCHYTETQQFTKELKMDPHDIASGLYILLAWYSIIRFITYYTMRYRLSLIS